MTRRGQNKSRKAKKLGKGVANQPLLRSITSGSRDKCEVECGSIFATDFQFTAELID